MTSKITIDFETRSECDLRKCGAYVYASHPSTEVLCIAYKIPGEEEKVWAPLYDTEPPTDLFKAMKKYPVEAHNANFEWVIWNLTQKHWPKLDIENLYCSAAKAAALSLPRSLKELARALKVSEQKDDLGHKIMLKLSKPRKESRWNKQKYNEDIVDYEHLIKYCVQDVLTEEDCSATMPELNKAERQVWLLDHKINTRGIFCDLENVKLCKQFISKYSKELEKKLETLTNGEVKTGRQVAKMIDYLAGCGFETDNLRKETIDAALLKEDLDPHVRQILEIRKALSKSSVNKLDAMLNMAGKDGRIRGTLLYHGSSTGRWAGRGIQPQNFIKGTYDWEGVFETLEFKDYDFFRCLYPNVTDAIASALRGLLCAPPGRKLIAADYSAIEARVVLWLAGDEENLDVFRKGEDIYKVMASSIYNKPVSQITKQERQMGKVAILGLEYQMGAPKFKDTCESWGIKITKEFSEKVVRAYRDKFSFIQSFWYACERAAIKAVESPGTLVTVGKIKFKKEGRFLFIQLPSSRKLAYNAPEIKTETTSRGTSRKLCFMGINSYSRKWSMQSTYGGKLVENITQAVARDLMASAMLRVEKENYETIMTVHDEIVCEVDEGFGSIKEFESLMSIVPNWAKGCPIAVEGWEGKRYRK